MTRLPRMPPADCPRERDGSNGPRRCHNLLCRFHLVEIRRRPAAVVAIEMALRSEHCVLDVASRGPVVRAAQLGRELGISPQAAHQRLVRALLFKVPLKTR